VDYLGIFDDVALALQFDEKGARKAVSNIAELIDKLSGAMQKCLAYFVCCDRALQGYEGLIAAQESLPTNKLRDALAAEFNVLARIW
jgi:type I restriction enzyme R subunit